MAAPKYTVAQVMALRPGPALTQDRLADLFFPTDGECTASDISELDGLTPSEKVWILRRLLAADNERFFVTDCARRAGLLNHVGGDDRLSDALSKSVSYGEGTATITELREARAIAARVAPVGSLGLAVAAAHTACANEDLWCELTSALDREGLYSYDATDAPTAAAYAFAAHAQETEREWQIAQLLKYHSGELPEVEE